MRLVPMLTIASGLAALAAAAFADPPAGSAGNGANAVVTLIDGWRQSDGSRVAGIAIDFDPSWHTYWRVPGEAGIPPDFDWSGSENLAAVRYEWPAPTIIDSYGLQSFGYVGSLVLPVLLTPKDPAAPMNVALSLSFGVCNDVCMQENRRVAARFAPETDAGPDAGPDARPDAGRARIEAALAAGARTADEAGVAAVTCAVAPEGDGYALTAEVTFDAPQAAGQVAVLESTQPGLWIGDTESETTGPTTVARAPVTGDAGAGPVLERRGLRVTVLDGSRAVDIRGCKAPG